MSINVIHKQQSSLDYSHLSPLFHTEDPIGVVAVLSNTMQFNGVTPWFSEIFI